MTIPPGHRLLETFRTMRAGMGDAHFAELMATTNWAPSGISREETDAAAYCDALLEQIVWSVLAPNH
jgi:hypothetical protein